MAARTGLRRHVPARIAWVALAALVLTPATASAFRFVPSSPTFPSPVVVGQVFPAAVAVSNTSTPPESIEDPSASLVGIELHPSCAVAASPCTAPNPGVFELAPTGAGASDCEGTRFTIAPPDASGTVTIVPDSPVHLSTGQTCVVNFSAMALRVPPADASPGEPGVQTRQVARAHTIFMPSGTQHAGSPGFDVTTVLQAQPELTTQASPSVRAGGQIHDTATLSPTPPTTGGTPTGTIAFRLYGPDDESCAGPPAATYAVDVDRGYGSYDSPAFTATEPGTYRWVAEYSGDHSTAPTSGACNDPNESVEVTTVPPPPQRQCTLVERVLNVVRGILGQPPIDCR